MFLNVCMQYHANDMVLREDSDVAHLFLLKNQSRTMGYL